MEWVRLTEISNPKQWKTISKNQLIESGYPVYGANGKIGFYNKYNHEDPTILITCRGATCGTLNISEPYSYINGNAMSIDDLNVEKVNIMYLYYFLKYRGFNDVISGSAQPQITRTNLEKILIPLFENKLQLKIVKSLEKIEDIIKKRREQIQAYDDLIESLFFDMLQYELMSDKIEYSKLGDLTSHISSGSTPRGGSSVYKSEGIPLIRSQDVKMNNLDYSNVVYIDTETHDKMKRSKLKNRDVLLNITGASIGRTAVFYGEDDSANTNQHVAAIRLKDEKVSPEFLSFYFSTEYFQAIIKNISSGGTREALNYKQIREFDIPLISKIKQEKFIKNKEKIEEEKKKLEDSLAELETLFDALMQDAFSGNLFKDWEGR